MGRRGYGGGGRGRAYTYRYTVTTRMTCIKMGSDESRFNVSLIVKDKVTRPCPQTKLSKRKESRSGIEPRSFRLPAYRLTARPNRLSASKSLLHSPLTLSLPQPVKFPSWKMQGRACKQYIFRSYNRPSMLCILIKIFSHVTTKKRRKRVKGLKFRIFIGRFQVTSWQ